MTADQPARPANIANIVAINQGRRPLTMRPPVARPLSPSDVSALGLASHVVIDARSSRHFAAGHLVGSINVQLSSPEFEQRVGWVAPPDSDLVLVVERDEDATAAMRALAFVGLDARVTGYLAGGVAAWSSAGLALEQLEEIDVQALHARLAAGAKISVLDVRERTEWDGGHVPGAAQVSYRAVDARVAAGLGPGEMLAIVCASGGRSSTAASLLLRAGERRVMNVVGGTQAWMAQGFPVERAEFVCS